jgi:transposase
VPEVWPEVLDKLGRIGDTAGASLFVFKNEAQLCVASPEPPPACPELDAAENIWQYLRQTYLSNRVFKTYTDILDACQEAWQKLLDETGRIASIATRDWAIIDQTI